MVNSLWPSDVIWQHRSGSTLAQIMAWCQAITWTNVDLSSIGFCDINLGWILHKVIMVSICKMSLKSTFFKSLRGQWVNQEQSKTQENCFHILSDVLYINTLIARFIGPTWGPSVRPQVGPMFALWTLLSGYFSSITIIISLLITLDWLWPNFGTCWYILIKIIYDLSLLVLSRRRRLMPWLLMPWFLMSPGPQQPWYWLCRINSTLASMGKLGWGAELTHTTTGEW